ncbi:RHS repeat-associated core domain-containing protein [Tenacibaculum maritimum]
MYDEEGEQVWERSLDLNGKVINGSNAPCPFLYQGQYYDKEIELAYNRFRYYDPDDGRYISKDPIGLLSGEYGFYNYVGDSNSWVDPFGLVSRTYKDASYHSSKDRKTSKGGKSKKPKDGQAALDNSTQVKDSSPRRVGASEGELVVIDRTRVLPDGAEEYHGHVRKWKDLHVDQQNALKNAGITNSKGKII